MRMIAAIVLALCAAPVAAQSDLAAALPAAAAEESPLLRDARILEMHSEAMRRREAAGLGALALDAQCCAIAQRWAEHMAKQNSMYHGGGEQIIARGYRSVHSTFNAWMSSSGHRAWVLTRSRTRCGWGAAQSASGQWYYAGVFRASLAPAGDQPQAQAQTRSHVTYTVRPRRRVVWRRRR